MHHKSIGPSSDHLRAVEAAIYVHFDQTVHIRDIFEVGVGANGSAHYVAHDDTDQRWGLKASVRGVAEGTEREALISRLALILEVPNAPKSVLCVRGAFLFRSDLRFAITPWISEAKPLADLDGTERRELATDARDFGRQFGEWMAFGLLFGVVDRHDRNWVWVPGTRQLAMIDMEECLSAPALLSQYHIFRDYAGSSPDLTPVLAEVEAGAMSLFAKLKVRDAATSHLLSHAAFRVSPAFTGMYPDANSLFRAWTSFYGL